MPVFSKIKEKLFGKKASEPEKPVTVNPVFTAQSGTAAAAIAAGKAQAAAAAAKAPPPPQPVKAEPVDIAAVLDAAVKAKGQTLNWRVSIVDLMKALDLDSSLAARKELAAELNYSGPHADGSAEKNIWLHKELMKALAENGGKIPADLLK
ncbi:MAG: DUF3597 domain-containing protein [Treponema sp.]|nr:DUF3597 domain-containing protein [Treponema sp.]